MTFLEYVAELNSEGLHVFSLRQLEFYELKREGWFALLHKQGKKPHLSGLGNTPLQALKDAYSKLEADEAYRKLVRKEKLKLKKAKKKKVRRDR